MTPRWQDLLQEYFDGEARSVPIVPSPADREAVDRLVLGLSRLTPPAPPADLGARITARLQSESRDRHRAHRRRFAPLLCLVAAASLLLALGLRLGWPVRDVPVPPDSLTQTEPLRDSIGRAGTALASLTTQTAETTVENSSSLLPLVSPQAMPSLQTIPEIEPTIEPFREASAGVSTGLAPVTDSAKRAVRLFMRDLPVVRSTPNKPG